MYPLGTVNVADEWFDEGVEQGFDAAVFDQCLQSMAQLYPKLLITFFLEVLISCSVLFLGWVACHFLQHCLVY